MVSTGKVQDEFRKTLNKFGFDAVALWRSSLRPLRTLEAEAKGASHFIFEFQETALDMVNIDVLTEALDNAVVKKSVRERLTSEGIMRYVIVRSLKSTSVVCRASKKRGGRVSLDLGPSVPPQDDTIIQMLIPGALEYETVCSLKLGEPVSASPGFVQIAPVSGGR